MATEGQDGPPSNLVAIFVAQFHVRNGNEIAWQSPQSTGVDLSGVEWKVLPSGAHLVERDTIYFRPNASGRGDGTPIGVAYFRNKKVASEEGAEGSASGRLNQRGARMLAVGVVLDCTSNEPSAQLDAALPHLRSLAQFAEILVTKPAEDDAIDTYKQLAAYHEKHAHLAAGKLDERIRRMSKLPQLTPQDPILDLPALAEGLGPLMPSLLKRLLLSSTRLLIFSAPPMQSSASLAFNLSLLVRASQPSQFHTPLIIRGIVGLHDIGTLSDEDRARSRLVDGRTSGWIAWTSDKLLLEKSELYDVLLDLTPLSVPRTSAHDTSTKSFQSSLPRIAVTYRPAGKRVTSKPQSWTARELTTYQLKDDEARDLATQRPVEESDELEQSNGPSEAALNPSRPTSLIVPTPSAYNSAPTPISRLLLTLYALLRYYTGGMWHIGSSGASRRPFLSLPIGPSDTRGQRFILPLGIREDGGTRSSLLVLGPEEGEDGGENVPEGLRHRLNAVVEDEDEEDPLIAAAGGSRRARSRSRSRSRSHVEGRAAVGVGSSVVESAIVDEDEEEAEEEKDEEEHSVALAHALASVWARWGAQLVRSVEDLVTRSISTSTATLDDHDGSPALAAPLLLSASDLNTCGLSASNALDVQLVRAIGNGVMERLGNSTREIKITRGLPILRWFV